MTDAVVIGGGHNGLVAAARLAQTGRRVLLLERAEQLGGLCAGIEFHPGYSVPGLLHDTSTLRPAVVETLRLEKHGLRFRPDDPPVLAADHEGPGLLLPRSPSRADELCYEDRLAYERWRRFLDRVSPLVARVFSEAPPPLLPKTSRDLWHLASRGITLRRLGRTVMRELLRITPMCAADWLGERFEEPRLAALLAMPALLGGRLGPWAAGTAGQLLVHECTRGKTVEGGPRALAEALRAAASSLGVEMRSGSEVERIRTHDGGVKGITLNDGEQIDAPVVAASCDPGQTLLELLPPGALSLQQEDGIRNFRSRGTTAKVHLALAGPLEIRGREAATVEQLQVGAGHVDEIERAFDAVKYRRFSSPPHLDVTIPTLSDPSLAPEGHHVVSILVSCAPHGLEGGWTEAAREQLGDAVVTALARCTSGLEERLLARQVLTPDDLEKRYSLPGGHLHHGEQSLDQLLFLRPAPFAARYETPVRGLYLAGSGCHPGGGITGAPGLLAAERILRVED